MISDWINQVLQKIANLFAELEAERKRVGRMAVSGSTFAFFSSEKDFMDGAYLELRPDWEESGLQGTFWNAQVYINDHVPDDHVVLFPDGGETFLARALVISGHKVSPSELLIAALA